MKVYAPDYYSNFKCIADKCKHNCCIGWEIDIDDASYKYYKSINSVFGRRVIKNIDSSETPHFILNHNDRCPFLNSDNLCDIYIKLGEDGLCNICKDHPRFRNFYEGITEIGLGLTCEASVELILTKKEKTSFCEISSDGTEEETNEYEQLFFGFRNDIIDILQNRSEKISKRIELLLRKYEINLPEKSNSEWVNIYLGLEILNPEWIDKLNEIKSVNFKNVLSDEFEIAFEQLAVYFIYRHLADGLADGKFKERIAFSVLSCYIIYQLFVAECKKFDEFSFGILTEVCRMYSSEIEYCEENIAVLLEVLCDAN